jgi:hypothetical protein
MMSTNEDWLANESRLRQRLVDIVLNNAPLMLALRAANQIGLASWAIGAGAIRSLVWDHLHGFTTPTAVADWDFIYFDPSPSPALDEAHIQKRLQLACPEFNWDVVNQATVHQWVSKQNGIAVSPFTCLKEGIASWPETATCVAVSINQAGELVIIAPLGLADLFDMRLRFNSRCISVDAYRQRILSKRLDQIWPKIETIPA